MRLGREEKGLCITDIRFLGEEDEESGAETQEEQKEEKEEDGEGEDTEAEAASKNGKRKGKGRGRGRPRGKAGKNKAARHVKKSSKPKMDEIQVKVNGSMAKESEDHGGEWHLDLLLGPNVIEIGEKGGLVWKVFAERLTDEQL